MAFSGGQDTINNAVGFATQQNLREGLSFRRASVGDELAVAKQVNLVVANMFWAEAIGRTVEVPREIRGKPRSSARRSLVKKGRSADTALQARTIARTGFPGILPAWP